MVILNAHFDGKNIIIDEPMPLPLQSGARLKIRVETVDEKSPITPAPQSFEPLKIHIDSDLSHAIALDAEFNIEES